MNILIENQETLEYLTAAGGWSRRPLEGKRFASTRVAFRAAKLEAIGKFNIVLHVSGTPQMVNLDHGRGTGSVEAAEPAVAAA